jgi:putative FmdB family regulatory protein
MPIYEYECTACKFYVEALQKISEKPLKQCPSCKKQTLKKLVSAPVFRLKGGGWYETDFKSEKEEKRNLADREEAPETKSEDAKETKPEAKETAAAEKKEAVSKPAAGKTKAAASAKARPKAKAKPAPKPVSKSRSRPKPAAKKK